MSSTLGKKFFDIFLGRAGYNISDRKILLFFAGIMVLELIIIRPYGNYPVLDDWQPALAVLEFVGSGKIFYPEYLTAFSLPQILWGIIASSVFGFSFVALRVSTIFFAWGCLYFTYAFLRENKFSQKISVAATSLLLASPFFIFLSFTFMSDVPALFFLLGALFFFSRGFRRGHYPSLALGALFSGIGFFTRQFDILIAIAAMLIYFFGTSLSRKMGYSIFGLLFAAITAILVILSRIGITAHHAILSYIPGGTFFEVSLIVGSFILLLIIFFVGTIMPAIIEHSFHLWNRGRITIPQFLLFIGVVVIGGSATYFLLAPFLTIVTYYGFGSVHIVMPGQPPLWGRASIYWIFFGICLLGIFAIYSNRTSIRRFLREQPWNAFFWCYAILYSGCISIFFPLFDRYYVLLLPFACYIGAILLKTYSRSLTLFYLGVFAVGVYGLIGTYNYFAWNDARWELGGRMVESGIPREQINGGYEWNGWYFYKEGLDMYLKRGIPQLAEINNFLFNHNALYILSHSPLPDTVVIDSIQARGIFSNIIIIYALKKEKSEY